MPFKSTKQRGYLFANNPKVAAEFQSKTPKGAKLPKYVKGSEAAKAKRRKKKTDSRR